MPKLRHTFACLIAVLLNLWYSSSNAAVEHPTPGQFLHFNHNKVERKYLLHVPKNLPDNAPLVFMLHGYHGDARDYMAELGMNRVANERGFGHSIPGDKETGTNTVGVIWKFFSKF